MTKNNIILCGLPGSGKTTVGAILSKKLKYLFLDTDHLIEWYYYITRNEELSCREIVKKEGFTFFRHLECHLINGFSELKNCVIALGGGTLTSEANVEVLRSVGKLIYLKGDPEQFFVRTIQNGIPLYLDAHELKESFNKLASEREKIYSATCDLNINTINLTPHEIVTKLSLII